MAVAAVDAAASTQNGDLPNNLGPLELPHNIKPLDFPHNNIGQLDVQTIQFALQQQQQNLQQQLKHFLFSQTSSARVLSQSNGQQTAFPSDVHIRHLHKQDSNDLLETSSHPAEQLMPAFTPSHAKTSSQCSSSPPPLTSLSPSPFSSHRPMSPLLIPNHHTMVGRLDLPADENVDLEELERFAKEFKQRRIKLGTIFNSALNSILSLIWQRYLTNF